MTIETFFEDTAQKDPSWKQAQQIAQQQLMVPSHVWNLIRNSWLDLFSMNDFIHTLSFSRLNMPCLLRAAGLDGRLGEEGIEALREAVSSLGIPLSGVVLAINHTCAMVLRNKPPPIWKPIFEQMMACIEIGAKMGARVSDLGTAGGALIGFSKGAGLSLLLAHNPAAFKKWYSMTQGVEGKELLLASFGCEPYQVAAFAIQQLGFGPEVAMGAAIATGSMKTGEIQLSREVLKWKAAFEWIDALREGRGYPAQVALRTFFPEIAPVKDSSIKNPKLDTLYTEVARVKRHGSSWIWHLPRPSYEETIKMLGGDTQ